MLEVILHQRTAVVGSGPPTMGVVGGAPPPPGGAPHGREGRPLNTPEETKTATGEVEGRMVKGSGSHRLVQVVHSEVGAGRARRTRITGYLDGHKTARMEGVMVNNNNNYNNKRNKKTHRSKGRR
jgi:hypothetical protein